jgi:uncharacterized membrane protein YbhN (UPF0104 family)
LAALSALVVLATYALLIEAWRLVVRAWGGHLGFGTAARIWSVSNLGRYLPGKVWSIAAMGLLARRAGVSAVAATGSSILVTLVNVAAGFAVLLLAGSRALALVAPGEAGKRLAVSVALAVTAGLVVLPWALPSLARLAVRLLRREVVLPTIAPGQLWLVVLANVAAWFGYGAAFLLLGRAVLPGSASVVLSAGSWLDATAVFTASYLAGYLALVVPGGLGVRELAMVAVLTGLGITGNVEAWLLALASRLWLTVLELLPGLLFLARDAVVRSPSTTPDAPS